MLPELPKLTSSFPSSGHEHFEAALSAGEALLVVYGHIQKILAEYSCNPIINLENIIAIIGSNLIYRLVSYLPAFF